MPKGKPNDLTGREFVRLMVKGPDPDKPMHYICACKCGNTISVRSDSLVTNNTKSCGCLSREQRPNQHVCPGSVFGPWTVIGRGRSDEKHVFWKCRCVCGSEHERRSDSLLGVRDAEAKCVCKKKDVFKAFQEATGESKMIGGEHISKNEYAIWCAMKNRCRNENVKGYENYGGRGITICEGLFCDCLHFIKIAGRKPSPGHSIGRPRNDDGYWCGECDDCRSHGWTKNIRWETKSEQARNTRNALVLTYEGQTLPLIEWAERKGIKYNTVIYRINMGWTVAKALETPVGQKPDS